MKKVILTFLSVLLMQSCAFALDSAIKFIQVTDVHYEANNPYKVKVLQETVKDINRLKNVSFVVFTGDNLNNPNPTDLVGFIKAINKLNVPYYLVLGDHDVFKSKNLSKDQYSEIVTNHNFFWLRRKWNYSFSMNLKSIVAVIHERMFALIPLPKPSDNTAIKRASSGYLLETK